jgi:predicted kinase
VLSKDLVKEALFDSLGTGDRAHSIRLGAASYAVLYAMIPPLLDAGVSLILECNFARGRAEPELRAFGVRADLLLVHCATSRAEIIRRYAARVPGSDRHPGHDDAAVLPEVLAQLDAGNYEPLDLAVPSLRVDTTRGYVPDVEAIRAFIRGPGAGG